jgi:sterol desaturase/sphingolipid hydroxylase (fatty acid hydroxylase superfamily)
MFEDAQALLVPSLIVFLACILLEWIVSRAKGISLYDGKDVLCNLGIFIVGRLSQPLFVGYTFYCLKFLETVRLWELPNTLATTILAIVLTDLSYYWEHRFSHTTRFLWFFHEVHHSSRSYNLTTSFRLHWFGRLVAPLIFAPLILLGFSANQVVLFLFANLIYQFFLHTKLVGKLGWLEGIVNTPSAHRVHHARNKIYIDKNFGGILMIWDRLFGTYQAETEEPEFGVLGKFRSYNPLTVQFHKVPGYKVLANQAQKLATFCKGS